MILKDLGAIARIANLPSVVSNVMVGCFFFYHFQGVSPKTPCLTAIAIGVFLYMGGCFLNDWKDHEWDDIRKNDRPIPSGRISRTVVGGIGLAFLIAGIGISTISERPSFEVSVVVSVLILTYTFSHKKTILSVIPMGLCRAGLYFLGAFIDFELTIAAIGLWFYICGVSLIARTESTNFLSDNRFVGGISLILLSVPFCWLIGWKDSPMAIIVATLIFLIPVIIAIRILKKSIHASVSILLAAIPLFDFIIILPKSFSLDAISFSAEAGFFLFVPIVAFVLSLIFQRFSSAT